MKIQLSDFLQKREEMLAPHSHRTPFTQAESSGPLPTGHGPSGSFNSHLGQINSLMQPAWPCRHWRLPTLVQIAPDGLDWVFLGCFQSTLPSPSQNTYHSIVTTHFLVSGLNTPLDCKVLEGPKCFCLVRGSGPTTQPRAWHVAVLSACTDESEK